MNKKRYFLKYFDPEFSRHGLNEYRERDSSITLDQEKIQFKADIIKEKEFYLGSDSDVHANWEEFYCIDNQSGIILTTDGKLIHPKTHIITLISGSKEGLKKISKIFDLPFDEKKITIYNEGH